MSFNHGVVGSSPTALTKQDQAFSPVYAAFDQARTDFRMPHGWRARA
jgi:hypothetical protein